VTDVLCTRVLVLNRFFQPVQLTTARRAFVLLYGGAAMAVYEVGEAHDFAAWRGMPVREGDDVIPVVVSSQEVARGKPAPDVYLEAARRLGVNPQLCAAVEDSHNGIRSAKAAGMRVVAIPNPHFPPGEDALAQADVVLRSIDELTPEAIEG